MEGQAPQKAAKSAMPGRGEEEVVGCEHGL